MKKLFYSWQSDSNPKGNRYLIQNTLKKIESELNKKEEIEFNFKLDYDTKGISGSPEITTTILGKIASSSIFICDITFINPLSKARKTPNPNVLFELGYAISILGWDSIICIFNTFYGKLEELPFDLRGRRHLKYFYNPEESKDLQKNHTSLLYQSLKNAISSIVNNNRVKGIKVNFTDGSHKLTKKVVFVDNKSRENIIERKQFLEEQGYIIYRFIIPEIIITNKTTLPLIGFKIKFWFSGDYNKIGNDLSMETFITFIEESRLKFIDENIAIYHPIEKILVPGDSLTIKEMRFIPKKEMGIHSIQIQWQVISNNCFDKGILQIETENVFISFDEFEKQTSITNEEFCILSK